MGRQKAFETINSGDAQHPISTLFSHKS